MKYWVYKESRILGPFDKEAVSGLPGLDSGTLVCAGDPAGGAWAPAGELAELGRLASGGPGPVDDFPSSAGLLDQLQIESAGLLGDDEFSAAFAEEMFQDAGFKRGFADILAPRASGDEAEARGAREKISELTARLEAMYRHVSELEAGHTDLARRLAAKDLELRARGIEPAAAPASTPVPAAESVKTFLSPAPPPIPGGPPPVAAVPAAAEAAAPAPAEWPAAPDAGPASFPSFGGEAFAPPAANPPPALPDIPSFSAPDAPASAALPGAPAFEPPPSAAPTPERRKPFGKAKSFKIVPTMKSFKVLGAGEAASAPSSNPIPEFKVDPVAEAPVEIPPAPAEMPPAPAEIPPPPAAFAPIVPPTPEPVVVPPPPIPVMAPPPAPTQAPVMNLFTAPAQPPSAPTPMAAPPNTLSRTQPVPDLFSGDMAGPDTAASSAPPATMARMGGAAPAAPADDAAAARFAKPEPAPPTGEIKKPGRNNKAFLIAGGVLVTLLVILGVVFMRQPKDDLRQMAMLDDGSAPIGLTAEEAAPAVAPPIAEPAPPAGPPAEHVAAIEAVKDFPLDGDRGTVGRWLQYSYTASPGAGAEEWNASTTGENTVLVEYRLVPGSALGKGALYLFEIDGNGIVMGKNIEARQMLAGAPPPEAPKAKKKPVKKAVPRRRVIEEPREVPLLPLPDSGELRPPAEDDGAFGSDTVNSGI